MARPDHPTVTYPAAGAGLPVADARALDRACDEFERKWRARGRPDLRAAVLELDPGVRPAGLRELLQLDLYYRRRIGEAPQAADYADRFPELDPGWLAAAVAGPSGSGRECGWPGGGDRGGLPAGGRVGDFELLGEVGRGGMAVVYRARQVGLNREVAVKMIVAGPTAWAEFRTRFLVEAEVVAALEHPHVVRLFAFGEHDGRPYLAMEYLPGGTLTDRVRAAGGLPAREAAAVTAKLARAVSHAHSRGIIHRDITPRNVLFGADGEPRLTDFGLAKVARSDLTVTGQVLGTAAYMATEQAAGRAAEVGTAADVYGVGAVLYHLLTGRPPFDGGSYHATLRKVVAEEPARPRSLVPGVPRDLETICLKCLSKEPTRRYPTAQALADDLGRFFRGEPIAARPPGAAGRAVMWVRRHKAAAAVAVALLGGSAVAVGYAVQAGRANAALLEVVAKVRTAAYPGAVREARQAWENGDSTAAREALDRCVPGPGEADLRGFEWYYLDACLRQADRVVAGHDARLLTADVSPDGTLVASGDAAGLVKVTELATGREVTVFRCPAREVTVVRFSPNNRTLAVGGNDGSVSLRNAADGSVVWSRQAHPGPALGLAWSKDGGRVASGGAGRAAKVWDAVTGDVRQELPHPDRVTCLAWWPKSVLLTGCEDKVARQWDPDTGALAFELPARDDPLRVLAHSPADRWFASAGEGPTIDLFHTATNRMPHRLLYAGGPVWSVAYEPGGRYLFAGQSGRVLMWDTVEAVGTVFPCRTVALARRVRAVAVTHQGRYLVVASEEPAEVRVRPTSAVSGYDRCGYPGDRPAASPGGDWLAVVMPDGAVKLRGPAGAERPRRLPDHVQAAGFPAFAAAGYRFVTVDRAGTMSAWNAATATRLGVPLGGPVRVADAAISPDGTWVVGKTPTGEVHAAPVAGGPARILPGVQALSGDMAFSADGSVLASATGRFVTLWRVGDWDRVADLATDQNVSAVALSSDGGLLAVGGGEYGLTLWDVAGRRRFGVLAEHVGPVRSAAFSPDGRTLATGGADGTVRLWNMATRQEMFVLHRNPQGSVFWVRFASPTRLLVGARAITRGQCEVLSFPPASDPGPG
ncbi:WD40 repeat domain-containing serine/threonine protein kinase [Urbifossiella limnaea]|uniref:non-specific serine/threonine protein kinase n=1 Tax=Urbifossiella limnaea TaxID=2528023 RepID=A0A517Y277_9BACT|nr:serine/threonine-protein kinase [Urbifossiella limnaea]QDU23873.1 Serine/threonine-protein kinase PrkC [Urbifossiella limnaea]